MMARWKTPRRAADMRETCGMRKAIGNRFVSAPAGLLLLLLAIQNAAAHKEPVHQYVVREGYQLLVQTTGQSLPQLAAHIGAADPSAVGDSAWQMGFVTTGAWREDVEDVVYHYDILLGLNYALSSITHFWSADHGDDADNMIRLQIEQPPFPPLIRDIGPYPNAFSKMMKYADGGWVLYYPRSFACTNLADNHRLVITPLVSAGGFGVPMSYAGLTDFYTSGELTVEHEAANICTVWDSTDLHFIPLNDLTRIAVGSDVRDAVVWEVLGRMCHLLGDMSVPAHAHLDEHGLLPDSYENYVGGAGDPYRVWNAGSVDPAILVGGPTRDVLHYLMYTMQQRADHFGSNGPANGDGNDDLGGDASAAEIDSLNAHDLGSFGGPTGDNGPWETADLNNIRDHTLPYAIRATAGLLYWFCVNTGILTSTDSPSPGGELTQPTSVSLSQNYPNPFNPSTKIRMTIVDRRLTIVRVYDPLGREVATLMNEVKDPGTHEVVFDASGLASGVYFYKLQSGDVVHVKRLVLMR